MFLLLFCSGCVEGEVCHDVRLPLSFSWVVTELFDIDAKTGLWSPTIRFLKYISIKYLQIFLVCLLLVALEDVFFRLN